MSSLHTTSHQESTGNIDKLVCYHSYTPAEYIPFCNIWVGHSWKFYSLACWQACACLASFLGSYVKRQSYPWLSIGCWWVLYRVAFKKTVGMLAPYHKSFRRRASHSPQKQQGKPKLHDMANTLSSLFLQEKEDPCAQSFCRCSDCVSLPDILVSSTALRRQLYTCPLWLDWTLRR